MGGLRVTRALETCSMDLVTGSFMVTGTVTASRFFGENEGEVSFVGSASFAPKAGTSSFADVSPVAVVFNPGIPSSFKIQRNVDLEEFQTCRTLIDLTGYRETRLVCRVVDHTDDVYLAAQFGLDTSHDPPPSSWSFLDGVGGPSVTAITESVATDSWVPITGSAKTDVVVRCVASGSNLLTTSSFQDGDGKGSVSDAEDAELHEGGPDSNFGFGTTINIDDSNHRHIVLKFGNIFGTGSNQIPTGSTINSASLTLEITNTTNVNPTVYQLIESWVEGEVTWNSGSAANAWTTPGADSTGSRKEISDGDFPMTVLGSHTMSVVNSVQNWSDGELNEGWLFEGNSNNNCNFKSSDNATAGDRPLLAINYTPPPSMIRIGMLTLFVR